MVNRMRVTITYSYLQKDFRNFMAEIVDENQMRPSQDCGRVGISGNMGMR